MRQCAFVVCGDCNSGWMSQIDRDAKHCLQDIILHDCNVCILTQSLAAIAACTMKSASIGDYITRHREPFFDHQTRQQFAHSQRPIGEAHMWIGRIQQPRGKKQGIYKTRYGQAHGSAVVRLLDTYVHTFSIEALFLQLAIARFNAPIAGDSAYSPELNPGEEARHDIYSVLATASRQQMRRVATDAKHSQLATWGRRKPLHADKNQRIRKMKLIPHAPRRVRASAMVAAHRKNR